MQQKPQSAKIHDMTLELNSLAASRLEAFRQARGLSVSDAILSLLQVAEVEASFDRLLEVETIPDEQADEMALTAVAAYNSLKNSSQTR